MQVRHLSTYDVAPETIAAFRAAIGETLLPVQALAVREGLFQSRDEDRGRNLVLAAPTSSGKSFVGEMAAIHAAQAGRRAFYLVPLKAMAEEVYRRLTGRYAGLGLRVAISTRDHRTFDDAIESGGYHVAVLVYEKLQSMLVARPELIDQVGLVVIDELQLLCDASRGPKLELLLTKLRRAQRSAAAGAAMQLLCLSAPLAGLNELGAWLGARVVCDDRRPVELRAGVLHRGQFTYATLGALGEGAPPRAALGPDASEGPRLFEDIFPDPGPEAARDLQATLTQAVRALCQRDEQTLIFFPDRARTLDAARHLAEALRGLPAATQAHEDIAATDEGQAREALLQTLQSAVAFHNADLTSGQRDAVERAFRRGEIRVLCATSTLALGVNLPAKNVILAERWKWRYSRRYNKWIRDDLTKCEYDGMSGRAGRLGLCDPVRNFGRSLLLAPSHFDADVWLRTLVDAPVQALEPTLLGKPLGDVILDLVASALGRDEAEIIDVLLSTFTGHTRWARLPGRTAFAESIGTTIGDLVRNDLLARDEDTGILSVTGAGRVCARKGLMVRSVVLLARWADAAAPLDIVFTPLEVLLLCALTPDGGEAHVPLTLPEHRFGDYWTRILLRAQELGAADRRLFRWLRDQAGRLTYDQTKAVKKALLLMDWVDSHDSAAIERDHSVWSGAVAHAAADFAWLVESLADLCDARGWPSERTGELVKLAERLRYGVDDNLLSLARATSKVLPRTHLQRVAAAGLTSEDALMAADPQVLERAVGRGSILQKILQIQAARRALQQAPRPAVAVVDSAQRSGAPSIEASNAGRGVVLTLRRDAVVESAPVVGDMEAVPLDEASEPGPGARLSPPQRGRAVPRGADLPLSKVLVDGTPAVPAGDAAELRADPPEACLGPRIDPGLGPMMRPEAPLVTAAGDGTDRALIAAATALPPGAAQLPLLRPVLVRPSSATPRPRTSTSPGDDFTLALTTETGPRRCYILAGGTHVALSPGSFALLFRLALRRDQEVQAGQTRGWVRGADLGKSAAGVRKGVSRLRQELRQISPEARSWVENDGHGDYRLSLSAPAVALDREALRQHPLALVRAALRAA